MYNHQTNDPSSNADTSVVAALLEKLVLDEEWYEAFQDGRHNYGHAFTAFLLMPEILTQVPEQLVSLFDRAFVLENQKSEAHAREALLERSGWEKIRSFVHRDPRFKDLLRWDENELRAAFEKRYAFINTYEGCFVFRRDALNEEQ